MSNKVYDVIKYITVIFLPAASALLCTLNLLWKWNLPIEKISGTISAVITFLGALLTIKSAKYKKEGLKNEQGIKEGLKNEQGIKEGLKNEQGIKGGLKNEQGVKKG